MMSKYQPVSRRLMQFVIFIDHHPCLLPGYFLFAMEGKFDYFVSLKQAFVSIFGGFEWLPVFSVYSPLSLCAGLVQFAIMFFVIIECTNLYCICY
jgi:hypothetical protein